MAHDRPLPGPTRWGPQPPLGPRTTHVCLAEELGDGVGPRAALALGHQPPLNLQRGHGRRRAAAAAAGRRARALLLLLLLLLRRLEIGVAAAAACCVVACRRL